MKPLQKSEPDENLVVAGRSKKGQPNDDELLHQVAFMHAG